MLTKKEIAFIILTKKQRIYWLSNQEYISLQKLFLNKEMKETLNKVADYEEWVKQKALKAENLAFASMFLISIGVIIIQLLLAVNLRLVLGETLIALVGGIVYAFLIWYIMVSGIKVCLRERHYGEIFSPV